MLLHTFTDMQNIIHIVIMGNRSTMLSKHDFLEHLKTKWMVLKTYFGLSTLNFITILVNLMLKNLYGKENTSEMVTVICSIKNSHFLAPRFLVLLHADSHQRIFVLVHQSVLGVNQKQLNLVKYLLLLVMYQRNRVLFIHLPVLNQLELSNIIHTNYLMKIVQVIPGMKRMMHLITSQKNGVRKKYFHIIHNLSKESRELTLKTKKYF